MKPYLRILIGIIIICLGVKAVQLALGGYDIGLFHELQYIPFVLLLIFTMAALRLETGFFKIKRRFYQYSVSLTGLVFTGIVVFKMIQHSLTDNSRTVLQVSNVPAARNVLTFEFKAGNHFRLTEHSKFGGTVFYGNYHRTGDSLLIRSSNYDGEIPSLPQNGIIRSDTVFWTGFDTMLIDRN